ncbi:MAG: Ig-like domain-containing protein, partial [Gaiellales bacterium]
ATLRFRIETIVNGSVTKGGVAVTLGATSIGPGESFVWTPPANAYGLLSAFTVRAFDGTSVSPSAITVQAQVAAQVCTTSDSAASGWNIRQFQALGECTWVGPAGVASVQALVIGGGGGGGTGLHTSGGTYYTGGGGGAGGLVLNNAFAVSIGSSYRVAVGSGGSVENTGGGSMFGSVSANGGGYGGPGASGSTTATVNGVAGGSGGSGGGGGATYNGTAGAAGAGTVGQGSNGTAGSTGTTRVGGSGGGAGGTPTGLASSFTGTAVTYARGGSGRGTAAAQAAVTNSGNGGDANTAGSSGVVMIRWPTATPTITGILDQGVNSNTTLSGIAFAIGDADNVATALTVSALSSNTTVVPNGNFSFGGSGANRTLSITPATGQSGTSTITVIVSDGATSSSTSFLLTVGDLVKPATVGAIAFTQTNTPSIAMTYTAVDVGGMASIQAFYSTSASLTSPQLCATVVSSATSGTMSCLIPSTPAATYYVFTRGTDTAGNLEDIPGSADDSIIYQTASTTGTITPLYVNARAVTVAYTATIIDNLQSVTAYYSRSASLTSPTSCGSVTSAAASGSLTCTLGTAEGTYYVWTVSQDSFGNVEPTPGAADDSVVYDITAPVSVMSTATTELATTAITNVAVSLTESVLATGGTLYYSTSSNMASPVSCGTWTSGLNAVSSLTCTLPATDGRYYLAARATDAAGNTEAAKSAADDSIVLDRVAPTSSASITATLTNNPAVSVDFTAADANTITTKQVYYSTAANLASPTLCATVTSATTSGTVSCTLPSSSATYYVYTRTTDLAGNVEAAPGTADDSIVLDVTAPLALTTDLNAASDSGQSSTDNVTATRTPTIDVTTYEVGASMTVTATSPGQTSVSCTAVASTCVLPTLVDGTWTLTARQTDPAGNQSAVGGSLAIRVDNTAPVVTSFAYSANSAGGTTYAISFDEIVTGLAASDFTMGGTATGWSVTAVSGSGAGPYTLTLTGANRGTLIPQLVADAVVNQVSLTGATLAVDAVTSTAQEPWLSAQPTLTLTTSSVSQNVTLSVTDGTWVVIPGGTVSRKWQYSTNGGTVWADYGSTAASITPSATYKGNAFRTIITYTNTHGTMKVASPAKVVTWFAYTGASQSWTPPAGVTSVQVDASGAGGGSGTTTSSYGSNAGVAGRGGRVNAQLTTTPGTPLTVFVGGKGANSYEQYMGYQSYSCGSSLNYGPYSTTAGWNGGGAGSNSQITYSTNTGSCYYYYYYYTAIGAAGGGATDVRTGGTGLVHRVLVAGGGGGVGASTSSGGAGGGITGGNGTGVSVGGGGTQSAAGSSGGAVGTGGTGTSGGGGGGGGYYGGGGATGQGGGGGGGSSYVGAGTSNVTHTQGDANATGDGFLALSYDIFPDPSVVSIDPHADPIVGRFAQTFSLGFTGTPTGFDTSDLTVTGVTGWDITSMVGYGLGPYMVTITPGSAPSEGTLGLRLNAGSVTVGGSPAPAANVNSTGSVVVDLTGPAMTSFATTSLTPTNAATLTYTLTLNSVTIGIANSDFSNVGTATGCVFTATGTGATRTVTIASCGEGTVIPRFTPSSAVTDAYFNQTTFGSYDGRSTLIDRTAPTAPTTPDLVAASDLGQSSTDDLTKASTPTISIGGLEADASAVITAAKSGATSVTCSIASSGIVGGVGSCALPTLADGTWSITARQTDYATTVSTTSAALTITIDTVVPNVSWTTLPPSLVTGTTATYVATFTEAVYDVAAADFINASNATGCVFSPSADTGTTRTVDVTCNDGGLAARFVANGAIDTAGNTGPSAARTATATTAMRKLYDFTSHTFTPCGATGLYGPGLGACQTAYSTSWDADTTLFTLNGGIQYWQVPVTGTYEITAAGAAGAGGLQGSTRQTVLGGGGMVLQGRVDLTAGDVLKILPGQVGTTYYGMEPTGGGGGGSFVTTSANAALVVAGGGGGNGYHSGYYSGTAGSPGVRTT